MTKTLTVQVNMSGVMATWQENEQTQSLPTDFTGEMVMAALEEVMADVLDGDMPENIDVQNNVTGLVVLDESSKSITPVLIADDADVHFIEALTMNGIGGQLARKNGHALTTDMPVIQILRLKNNVADVYARAKMYLPLTAYLRSMLTEENAVTAEEAALTGVFDDLTGTWDIQALALTGVTMTQLPAVTAVSEHVLTNPALLEKMSTLPSVKVR